MKANMRKNLIYCGSCLLATVACTLATEEETTESFSRERYAPIIKRSPFGKEEIPLVDTQTTASTRVAIENLEKSVRLSFLLKSEDNDEIRAGFQNLKAKEGDPKSAVLMVGDSFQGMKLLDVDLDAETAKVNYQGKEIELTLGVATQQTTTKKTPTTRSTTSRRINRGFQPREQREEVILSEEEKAEQLAQIREELQQQQMEIIRKGQPPLPIALTQESDDQLVSEGILPPIDEEESAPPTM